jgi:hypothetical protein
MPPSTAGGNAGGGVATPAEPLQPHDWTSLHVKPGPQLASSVHGSK